MSDLSQRFEKLVESTQKKLAKQGVFLPVKDEKGIHIGPYTIQSVGPYKNIYRSTELVYEYINLNSAAIKIINALALGKSKPYIDSIYSADQDYDRLFREKTGLLNTYHTTLRAKDSFKAEILWARYLKIKDLADHAKKKAIRLSRNY